MISEFALYLFTTLAGIAGGAYVARALAPLDPQRKRPWVWSFTCLVLLAISGVALLCHLGQPLRVMNAFSNPGAGITQEGITTVLFGLSVLADFVFCLRKRETPHWLVYLAAVLGVLMTLSMGFAYYHFTGTMAWATPLAVPFFVMGDLAMGAGFLLLFRHDALGEKTFGIYNVIVQIVAALCIACMGVHFAEVGYSPVLFALGVVGTALAVVFGLMGRKDAVKPWLPVALCIGAIAGVALARYGFYLGCII